MADVDWGEPFHSEYRYMRVSRATGSETARLPGFLDGGSIERNADTQVKEKGAVNHDGPLEIGADLVRVYLDATGLFTGWTASEPLGTFLASTASRDVRGAVSTCKVDLSGRLDELAKDQFECPISVPAGSDPVEKAVEIARGAGLDVLADPSSYRLSTAWTFGLDDAGGESKLDAVNDLLEIAGFSSAATDPMGRVVMRRYVSPNGRDSVHDFKEGADARFLRSMTDELDASDVANVVVAVFSDQDSTVIGTAVDSDPRSPYSTASIGRRLVARYEYNYAATQRQADAKAAELLKTNQSVIRRVTFVHAYTPLSVGDVVSMGYATGGVRESFAIRAQSISLGAGCLVKCEGRAYGR